MTRTPSNPGKASTRSKRAPKNSTRHNQGKAPAANKRDSGIVPPRADTAESATAPISHATILAKSALDKYSETGDLRYLCLHYHYHAEDMRNRHRCHDTWADLARFHRLKSYYHTCAANIADEFIHVCEKHRHLALYWQICFKNTKQRAYLCAYFLALKNYFHALLQIKPDPLYRQAEDGFNAKYENCIS